MSQRFHWVTDFQIPSLKSIPVLMIEFKVNLYRKAIDENLYERQKLYCFNFVKAYCIRAVNLWELLGVRNQNIKKKKKNYILQFFLRLRPSNCISVLTLRKSDKQRKKRLCFPWCVRFYILGGMFHIRGRFYMFGVRTWEIVSRCETHAQCVELTALYCIVLFFKIKFPVSWIPGKIITQNR